MTETAKATAKAAPSSKTDAVDVTVAKTVTTDHNGKPLYVTSEDVPSLGEGSLQTVHEGGNRATLDAIAADFRNSQAK